MHSLRVIFYTLTILITSSVSHAEDKSPYIKKQYSFSVNNLLLPSANSTVGLGRLSFDFYRATLYPIDLINQKFYTSNQTATTVSTIAYALLQGVYVMLPVSMAYHEFGHARGLLAYDSRSNPTYYAESPNLSTVENPFPALISGKTYYHMLWSFLKGELAGFVLPSKAETLINTYYSSENKDAAIEEGYKLIDLPTINQIPIWAGGFNNQAMLASTIEDEAIHRNGYYAFDILAIAFNKLIPSIYPTEDFFITSNKDLPNYKLRQLIAIMNDHGSVKRHYCMNGIIADYEAGMSTTGSLLSFLLSGSTYQGFYNIYNYACTGQLFTPSFNYKGFYLPNTSFFFTSQGLSLRFKAAYQWDPTLLLMATYEAVYKGKSTHEFKVSAYKTIPEIANIQINIGILLSTGTQGSFAAHGNVGVKLPVHNNFNIEAAYYLWNKNTLDGGRNISNGEKGNLDHEIMCGISAEF